MKDLVETLRQEFQDEDYRYAYDEEFSNALMATQIKVLRGEVTQKELAEKTGMKQSRISELENVNYSMWSISTLRRLARALGVRISFKFESWGELLSEVERFGPESLKVPAYEEDPAFQPETTTALTSERVDTELQRMLAGATNIKQNGAEPTVPGPKVTSMNDWISKQIKDAPTSAREAYEPVRRRA